MRKCPRRSRDSSEHTDTDTDTDTDTGEQAEGKGATGRDEAERKGTRAD